MPDLLLFWAGWDGKRWWVQPILASKVTTKLQVSNLIRNEEIISCWGYPMLHPVYQIDKARDDLIPRKGAMTDVPNGSLNQQV